MELSVWFSRRWSSTLLLWPSFIVVALSCYDSLSMHCLSWANCSSCWPILVKSVAKECSLELLVVVVVIAATSGTVTLWAVLARGLRCCSDGARGTWSTTGDLPGRRVTGGPSTWQARMSLDSSSCSLARARCSYCHTAVGDLCEVYCTLNTMAHVQWV